MNTTEPLVRLLISAKSVVAFTGAGISTESGIPDFRSPGGVWKRYQPVMYDEFVSSRAARARYWRMRVEAYRDFAAARPNDGHFALARLEALGRLRAVVTQNIDGLHQMAGSRQVVELHGTARIVGCIGCDSEWPPEVVHARIESGDEAPDCEICGSPLKSKTVSFGQAMPVYAMAEGEMLARESDLYLAIGSSLVVEPAASLPRLAKQSGATLVIINRDETPIDLMADMLIRAPIGQTLRALLEAVVNCQTPSESSLLAKTET